MSHGGTSWVPGPTLKAVQGTPQRESCTAFPTACWWEVLLLSSQLPLATLLLASLEGAGLDLREVALGLAALALPGNVGSGRGASLFKQGAGSTATSSPPLQVFGAPFFPSIHPSACPSARSQDPFSLVSEAPRCCYA